METNNSPKIPQLVEEKPAEIVPPAVQTVQLEEEPAEPPKRKAAYIELAEDENGQWHWCLWSANGRAIAANVKGFPRRNDAQKSVETAIELFRDPKLSIVANVGN